MKLSGKERKALDSVDVVMERAARILQPRPGDSQYSDYELSIAMKVRDEMEHEEMIMKERTRVGADPALTDDCKKLLGLPPYNTPSNYCWNDAYFAKAMERRFGKDAVDAEIKRLGG